MRDRVEEQRRLILDQFTKQAVPFAQMPAHSNEESVRLLIDSMTSVNTSLTSC